MKTSCCPYTGLACDGGRIYPSGAVGCGFMGDGGCVWPAEVPDDMHPRDYYNEAIMEVIRGNGD